MSGNHQDDESSTRVEIQQLRGGGWRVQSPKNCASEWNFLESFENFHHLEEEYSEKFRIVEFPIDQASARRRRRKIGSRKNFVKNLWSEEKSLIGENSSASAERREIIWSEFFELGIGDSGRKINAEIRRVWWRRFERRQKRLREEEDDRKYRRRGVNSL